jgi:hypothetical protein
MLGALMILITRDSRNKHGIDVGDVFRVTEDEDYVIASRLFLVEKANEFVYSSGHGGIGYQGEIIGRPEATALRDSEQELRIVKFECTIGRRYMNKRIRDGSIARIAHYFDVNDARAAIWAWAKKETEMLVVPVPNP